LFILGCFLKDTEVAHTIFGYIFARLELRIILAKMGLAICFTSSSGRLDAWVILKSAHRYFGMQFMADLGNRYKNHKIPFKNHSNSIRHLKIRQYFH
jgi:hypothetical protein